MNIHSHLIRDLKNGSARAFNELYDIFADMLYHYVLDITKSPSEAKDILQETFLKIWQTKENINSDLSFKSYLYKISKNLIIDSFRKKMDSIRFENYINSDDFQDYSENNTEKKISFDEFEQSLQLAKKHLTERQLQIFELSREQGLSIPCIAKELNLSEQTVKNQLSLSLKQLRSLLSQFNTFFPFI